MYLRKNPRRLIYFRLAAFIALFNTSLNASSAIHELQYEGFTVFVDCNLRGAVRFEYLADKDNGSFPRKHTFTLDDDFSSDCQQTSSDTYKSNPMKYDRGHLVPANHLDHSKRAISQSNYMTNILPQARNMNRGAWLRTEEIIECYRDLEPLRVIGGVIWGYNPHDDFFITSHGIKTPDYFWKIVVGSNDIIAWIIPNSHKAKRKELDRYLASVEEIEAIANQTIDGISSSQKKLKHTKSWPKPSGCDLS